MFRGDLAAGGPKAGVGCGGVAEHCKAAWLQGCRSHGCKVAGCKVAGSRGGLVIAGCMAWRWASPVARLQGCWVGQGRGQVAGGAGLHRIRGTGQGCPDSYSIPVPRGNGGAGGGVWCWVYVAVWCLVVWWGCGGVCVWVSLCLWVGVSRGLEFGGSGGGCWDLAWLGSSGGARGWWSRSGRSIRLPDCWPERVGSAPVASRRLALWAGFAYDFAPGSRCCNSLHFVWVAT